VEKSDNMKPTHEQLRKGRKEEIKKIYHERIIINSVPSESISQRI